MILFLQNQIIMNCQKLVEKRFLKNNYLKLVGWMSKKLINFLIYLLVLVSLYLFYLFLNRCFVKYTYNCLTLLNILVRDIVKLIKIKKKLELVIVSWIKLVFWIIKIDECELLRIIIRRVFWVSFDLKNAFQLKTISFYKFCNLEKCICRLPSASPKLN